MCESSTSQVLGMQQASMSPEDRTDANIRSDLGSCGSATTGDGTRWLIVSREQVVDSQGENIPMKVESSSVSATPCSEPTSHLSCLLRLRQTRHLELDLSFTRLRGTTPAHVAHASQYIVATAINLRSSCVSSQPAAYSAIQQRSDERV